MSRLPSPALSVLLLAAFALPAGAEEDAVVHVTLKAPGYTAANAPQFARVKFNKAAPLCMISDDMSLGDYCSAWALFNGYPHAATTHDRKYARGDLLLDEAVRGVPAGFYDGGRRELVIRPAKREWGGPEHMEATVRHEGFHQWLHAAWPGAEAPTWFNEGTAEVFESFVPRGAGGSFEWREQESAARWLEDLAKNRDADWTAMLRATLLADQRAFYSPPHFGGDVRKSYAFAYGLMYFLHRGAPLVRNQPWKDVLPTLYRALYESPRDPVGATCAAFQLGPNGADTAFLEKFAADLRAFWRASSARQNARNAKLP